MNDLEKTSFFDERSVERDHLTIIMLQ